jgi:hypothetical protein
MNMPGRTFTAGTQYRYGFNGQEKSDEIAAGLTTAMYWEYDSRIGRRWNVDPVLKVWESPYLCLGGNPILYCDTKGDDKEDRGKRKYGRKHNRLARQGKTEEEIYSRLFEKYGNKKWMWSKYKDEKNGMEGQAANGNGRPDKLSSGVQYNYIGELYNQENNITIADSKTIVTPERSVSLKNIGTGATLFEGVDVYIKNVQELSGSGSLTISLNISSTSSFEFGFIQLIQSNTNLTGATDLLSDEERNINSLAYKLKVSSNTKTLFADVPVDINNGKYLVIRWWLPDIKGSGFIGLNEQNSSTVLKIPASTKKVPNNSNTVGLYSIHLTTHGINNPYRLSKSLAKALSEERKANKILLNEAY